MNQQEELELLIKENKKRFTTTIILVIIFCFILLIVFIIKDSKNYKINYPDIEWHVLQKNQQNYDINGSKSDKNNLDNSLSYNKHFDDSLKNSLKDKVKRIDKNLKDIIPTSQIIKKNKNSLIIKHNNPSIKKEFKKKEIENNIKLNSKSKEKVNPKEILEGKIITKSNNLENKVFIQIGAFINKNHALQQIKFLKKNGILSNLSIINTSKGELYKVKIGSFKNKFQAQDFLNKKLNLININGIIVDK